HVVGKDKSIHWRSCVLHVPHGHQVTGGIREGGDVIDGDGVERMRGPCVADLERLAAAHVLRTDVVDNHVVYAPASASQRRGSIHAVPGERSCHPDSASGMRNLRITDGDVSHLTQRAYIAAACDVLVFGGEQNAITMLTEASPVVFHEIRFDQHANRILEFQVILNDEGIASGSANKIRTAWHPLPRLPEVIAGDRDVGGAQRSRAAAEHDALGRGFEKVILDFEGTVLSIADASSDRMSVGTSPGD